MLIFFPARKQTRKKGSETGGPALNAQGRQKLYSHAPRRKSGQKSSFSLKNKTANFARLYKDKNGRALYEMNFSRSRPFFRNRSPAPFFYKIASTKLLASNFSRSSIFSPVPAKMTGRANSEANENTKPPFAVPSNLVRTRPSSSTASSNVRA